MNEHTPEPWVGPEHIDRRRAGFIRAGDPLPGAEEGQAVAAVSLSRREWKANQRRIVAAVNAVAGIPVEALEAGAIADLIAAAVEVLAFGYPDSIPGAHKNVADRLRAAISKLRPPQ